MTPTNLPPSTTPNRHERIAHLRGLSRILDDAFTLPGTERRVGIDPIIGLIPGVGDLIGVLFSAYIIVQAHALGVSRATTLRMLANLGIDALVGAIPFAGDLFDFAWKANTRNVDLLEQRLAEGGRGGRDVLFLVVIVATCVLVIAGVFWLSLMAMGWLFEALRGI